MRRTPLFLFFVTTLVTSLVLISSPEAKNRDKAWEFGAAFTNVDADTVVPIDNSFAGTITLGYHLSDKLEAELFLSNTSTTYGAVPNLTSLVLGRITQPRCRANIGTSDPDPECFQGAVTGFTQDFKDGDDFMRSFVQVTANFMTDRETSTIPYLSGGIGIISETREAFPYVATFETSAPDDDPCGGASDGDNLRETCSYTQNGENPESFDSSFLLTLGAGARTFFNDWFGVRYEARYIHHDSFLEGQNEWLLTVGATFVVGGQK